MSAQKGVNILDEIGTAGQSTLNLAAPCHSGFRLKMDEFN
jgi:hypothetical protein